VSDFRVERYYTTAQLAKLFCVHPETIRRAAGRGELRFVRVGRDYRFPESAVLEWLQERAAA
jgi:excisionase family DNA binding protein